jgi:GNAT superfamily N-acetyltransferase
VSGVRLPYGFRLERLAKAHPRKSFFCGQPEVDVWLKTKALQHQEKHLSVTKMLIDGSGMIAGYYTVATGQIDFGDLPDEVTRKLPRRMLPVALLAWLGVARECQGEGLGRLLLAQALRDCYEAGQTLAFMAVILDCVDDAAKAFYRQFDFAELPGHPYRLFLPFRLLEKMVQVS